MACVAMGCALMHSAVFRAISVVMCFLGSWLQCGGRNCGADMALEVYCGYDVVTSSWKTVNMLMLIDNI